MIFHEIFSRFLLRNIIQDFFVDIREIFIKLFYKSYLAIICEEILFKIFSWIFMKILRNKFPWFFHVIGYSGSIRGKRQRFVCWIRKRTSKKYKWSSPRQPSQSIIKTIAILESGTARIRISSGWSQIQIPRWCQYIQSIQYSTWSRYTYHLISLDQIMFNYHHYMECSTFFSQWPCFSISVSALLNLL